MVPLHEQQRRSSGRLPHTSNSSGRSPDSQRGPPPKIHGLDAWIKPRPGPVGRFEGSWHWSTQLRLRDGCAQAPGSA